MKKGNTENELGITVDEHVIINEQLTADHFNEFFVNVAFNLKQTQIPSYFEKKNWTVLNVLDDVSFDIPLIHLYYSAFRSLYRHVVCNIPISCKANGIRNQLGWGWLDSGPIAES